MRVLVVLFLLVTPALAQPRRCVVTIVRAPEDVRPVLEQWVRAEPSCNVSLDVRVIPTEGGYYILATDESHRERERIVPDAQSAGVLVASWIADDTMRAPSPSVPPPPADVPAPALIGSHGLFGPGEGRAPGLTAAKAVTPEVRRKWISLGATLAERGWGMRAEVDAKAWRAWAFGVAAAWATKTAIEGGPYASSELDFFDAMTLAYLSHTEHMGRWQLREALGAGLLYTRSHSAVASTSGWVMNDDDGFYPTADASLMLGRELGDSWAITTGVLASFLSQSYTLEMGSFGSEVVRRDLELVLTAAVRYRL